MSYTATAKSIHNLILELDNFYLPAIQREFVWESARIEELFDSLLRGYPIGTLLLWHVGKPAIHEVQFYELIRDYDVRKPHNNKANLSAKESCVGILDGQQRITSLFIGLLGSYTEKLPRLWWNNPNAFPNKHLYINLLYKPPTDDNDQRFQIKFLSDKQVQSADPAKAYWYRVGDILKLKSRDELRDFRRSTPHKDNNAFEDNLDALWSAIHERHSVNFFLETRQDLDEVLRIFARLNTGGTPLSYSDLLLSLATATWKNHDAREQVYGLLDYLNRKCGAEFYFSKDFILKALLVCSDHDVRFKAENIRKKNDLEAIWDRVKDALQLAVRLVARFGFSYYNLAAANAIIPVAYYLFRRGLDESFLTGAAQAEHREAIRTWLLKVLLGKVFGGQTDQLLTNIRGVIKATVEAYPAAAFPADAINDMLRTSRGFIFTDESLEALVSEADYGAPDTFAILSLLFPHLDFAHNQFHVDHIHPRAHFTKKRLAAVGLSGDEITKAIDRRDYLPNLQLLAGPVNEAKNSKPFAEWLKGQSDPGWHRAASFIPNTDLSLGNFHDFYAKRRQFLIKALKDRIGFIESISTGVEMEADVLLTGVAK